MLDHNITLIETNIKIVEELQNPKFKERDIGDINLNFVIENINLTNIDAELSVQHKLAHAVIRRKHSWIVHDSYQHLKTYFAKEKRKQKKGNIKYPETYVIWWKKDQNYKGNTDGNKSLNQVNVSNQIKVIENNIKISIKTET